MPGKSRRGKAKRSARSGKMRRTPVAVAQQQVATDRPATPAMPTSAPGVPIPKAAVHGGQHAHVVTELRRIGILAGIMLAVLVILALV